MDIVLAVLAGGVGLVAGEFGWSYVRRGVMAVRGATPIGDLDEGVAKVNGTVTGTGRPMEPIDGDDDGVVASRVVRSERSGVTGALGI